MTELAQNSAMLMKVKKTSENTSKKPCYEQIFFFVENNFSCSHVQNPVQNPLEFASVYKTKKRNTKEIGLQWAFFSFLFSETFEFLVFFSGEYVCFSVFDTKPSYFVCGGDSYLRILWGNLSVNKRNPLSKMQIIPLDINQEAPALLFRKNNKISPRKCTHLHATSNHYLPTFVQVPQSPKWLWSMWVLSTDHCKKGKQQLITLVNKLSMSMLTALYPIIACFIWSFSKLKICSINKILKFDKINKFLSIRCT